MNNPICINVTIVLITSSFRNNCLYVYIKLMLLIALTDSNLPLSDEWHLGNNRYFVCLFHEEAFLLI